MRAVPRREPTRLVASRSSHPSRRGNENARPLFEIVNGAGWEQGSGLALVKRPKPAYLETLFGACSAQGQSGKNRLLRRNRARSRAVA